MKHLLLTVFAATALTVPAAAANAFNSASSGVTTAANTASSLSTPASQNQGRVDPNSCTATQPFTVTGPTRISVLVAGTNAGGTLWAQVIGPQGEIGPDDGSFQADAAGSYGFQVCFRSDDGIDNSTISYVDAIMTSPR
jgi:hypothetical protein